jgi:hypothetical protein
MHNQKVPLSKQDNDNINILIINIFITHKQNKQQFTLILLSV